MTADHQLNRLDELKERIEELEAEFDDLDDKSKADLELKQALDAAKRDLKKAGAHVGYGNANRHLSDAENRLEGIAATIDL